MKLEFISAIIVGILVVCVTAVLSGTILYFLWPVTAVAVFHAPELTWWQSVVGMWTLGLIGGAFKTTISK